MSVDPGLTWRIIEEELQMMAPLVTSYGWEVFSDHANLTVSVKMKSSIDSEIYIVEAKCDDYKALPPFFEFIHPETKERGTKSCYPIDGSFFIFPDGKPPCLCVQWNRKAYSVHDGPHADWPMPNWVNLRPGMTMLGDFFHLVQRRVNDKQMYKGRMKP
jgi:hypothetical protein